MIFNTNQSFEVSIAFEYFMIYLQDMVTFLYLLNIEFWNEISLRWIIILVLEKKNRENAASLKFKP